MSQTSPLTNSSSFFSSGSPSSSTELPKVTTLATSSFPLSPYPSSQPELPLLTPPDTLAKKIFVNEDFLNEVIFAKPFDEMSSNIQNALIELEMNLHSVSIEDAKRNLKQKGSSYQLDLIIQDCDAECKFFVRETTVSVATFTPQSSQ